MLQSLWSQGVAILSLYWIQTDVSRNQEKRLSFISVLGVSLTNFWARVVTYRPEYVNVDIGIDLAYLVRANFGLDLWYSKLVRTLRSPYQKLPTRSWSKVSQRRGMYETIFTSSRNCCRDTNQQARRRNLSFYLTQFAMALDACYCVQRCNLFASLNHVIQLKMVNVDKASSHDRYRKCATGTSQVHRPHSVEGTRTDKSTLSTCHRNYHQYHVGLGASKLMSVV